MRIPRISNAINNLDDDIVEAAVKSPKKKMTNYWHKWTALAAGFVVLIVAGALILPTLFGREPNPGQTTDRYKDYGVQEDALEIFWPWDSLSIYEKYNELNIDGTRYSLRGLLTAEDYIGDSLGTCIVSGFDNCEEEYYTKEFEMYQLTYADKSQFIAVKMEETYGIFAKQTYEPPYTLGELMTWVNLPQVIQLNRFSVNGDGPDNEHFTLRDDNYIWEVLSECVDAPFVEDDTWIVLDREYFSFTITSEALGVYKVAMYITEDGYLWTNAFHYRYLFYIGEEAAGKIRRFAMEHSVEAEYEPYQNTLEGQIAQITDGYILLDDSILCVNPEDGITYKVLLNSHAVSRYVKSGMLQIGDTVQIAYRGAIDKRNQIDSAVSISEVIISDGEMWIPE